MGDPLVIDFDHHSKEFLDNRLAEWRVLRQTPVAYTNSHGGFWVVSGHAEVTRVSREEETFASEFGVRNGVECKGIAGVPRARGIPQAGIAEADPAVHQAVRRALNPYLLPNAVEAKRPLMEDLAAWWIDQKIETGAMDLVLDLANPVPAILTLDLLGLPCDGWEYYAELFHGTISNAPGSPGYDRAMSNVPAMLSSLVSHVRDRRQHPRPDLISELVKITDSEGEPLTDETVTAIVWNLVGGGLDTTTSLTALSLLHLHNHPLLRDQLIEHPELLPTATEEYLRYFSVNETLTRTVTRPCELGGQQLHIGDVVLLSWLSANHDEAEFDDPERVRLDRSPNRHLAFGVGPHRCIGMHLARVEYQVLMGAVLERMPDYSIDLDATRLYEGNPILAGVVTLPATFTPAPKAGPDARPF